MQQLKIFFLHYGPIALFSLIKKGKYNLATSKKYGLH